MNIETLVNYIKEDTKEKFDKVEQRFDRLEGKIDTLLMFKWQIIGGSAVLSIVVAFIFQLLSTFYK